MKLHILAAFSAAFILTSCQTHHRDLVWVPIIKSPPPAEMTLARCKLASASAKQGYFAYGDAAFVLGAGIGNAIDNEIRMNEFVINCMTMHGWRGVTRAGLAAQAQKTVTAPPVSKAAGKFLPAPAKLRP